MTWLTILLLALLGLFAVLMLLVAIGRPKLKHHLDAQSEAQKAEEGGRDETD